MHRSRPFVLAILAAAAACSKHDPSEGNDILSQDRSLAARIRSDGESRRPLLPVACGATTVAASPSAAYQQQADDLTRRAGVAEMHGNIEEARSLLRRASELDATNKSAAYHLGRTSEALGDRTSALTAYCRYLALAPTVAESTEARQRVADLSRAMPRATASTSDSVAVRRSVAVRSAVHRSVRASSSAPATGSPSVVASGEARPPTRRAPAPVTSTEVSGASGSAASGGEIDATPAATTDQPSPTARTQRRGSIGVQSTIIGVATGAILGAATGRSVKSTVIGAAAGGVLGTVVGSATRPARRSVRS